MNAAPELMADLRAFSEDLVRQDDLGAVLRAHIRIENHLIKLVESLASAPQQLARLQLEYDQYVTMALVMGLSPDWAASLRAIGRIRNSFAHRLDATLDAGAVNNLYEALPPNGKAQVHESYASLRTEPGGDAIPERFANAGAKERFQVIVLVIWCQLTAWLLGRDHAHGD